VIVRLVGVFSHFNYLEDARKNHKPKIHSTVSRTEISKLRRSWLGYRINQVGPTTKTGGRIFCGQKTHKKSVLCHSRSETAVTGKAHCHA
jgi:hypothetical protein